jgi:hypothetical protein
MQPGRGRGQLSYQGDERERRGDEGNARDKEIPSRSQRCERYKSKTGTDSSQERGERRESIRRLK